MPSSILRKRATSLIRSTAFQLGRRWLRHASHYARFDDTLPLPHVIPIESGVPIHLYCHEVEAVAMKQIMRLAKSPVPVDYIALMPDVHLGKGVTIGSVFASEKYVCPIGVGVDIGCGMLAVPIDGLYRNDLTNSQKSRIQQLIKDRIPTGFGQHKRALSNAMNVLDDISNEVEPTPYIQEQLTKSLSSKTALQLGTLGGGNHFLEVVYDDTPRQQVWCLLHSGSRNVGNQTATKYDQLAKQWLIKTNQDLVSVKELEGLHYLPIDSRQGQEYLIDMEWCQKYAYQNRIAMQKIMLQIIEKVTGKHAEWDRTVNIHHNYCQCEDCGSKRLWVTRKGATSAKKGEYGIIPGSMGTCTYITRGKGDSQSWNSSSHGAGRNMSRTRARKEIDQRDFEHAMRGIVADTNEAVKDEAPQAYKDLEIVMKNQKSLTEIIYKLRPLINVKGFETKGGRNSRRKKTRKQSHQ